MKNVQWGTWLLAAVITIGAEGSAQAQDVDAVSQAAPDSVERRADWYTLDHHLRVQIRRSRFYGGLLVVGTVVTAVGIGLMARFIFDDPEGSIFGTAAFVGGSLFLTGVVGLIVSGVRRIHIRAQRDGLMAAPLVWRSGPSGAGVGLVLRGVF
jgi:hypothetical protein